MSTIKNPYNKKYEETQKSFEEAYERYLNGTEAQRKLEGQAEEYRTLQSKYINDYLKRDKFSYDVNTDKLYAGYRDQYLKNAEAAQRSAQATAAGLTGGYGSTYAAAMGNSAYSEEMDKLKDKEGELYDRAYAQYLQDGQDLLDAASLYGSQADSFTDRAMTERQNHLADAAAYGEYGNYLYTKTDEYKAAQEQAAAEEDTAYIEEGEDSLATLLNTMNGEEGKEVKITSTRYKMEGDSQKGYEGIANAIDFEKDVLKNLSSYKNFDKLYNDLFERLGTVRIGNSQLTEQQRAAYIEWLIDNYDELAIFEDDTSGATK